MSKNIVISKKEYARLLDDKKRLDYLEKVVERGTIKVFGKVINFPRPKEPVRNVLDTYRVNDREF